MPKHSRSDYHGAYFLYYASRRFFARTWVSQSNVSTCFCFCWGAQKDREREMGLESPSSGFFYMVSHRFFVVAHLAVALLEAALMHHICLGLSSGGKKCSNSSILWQKLLCVCAVHLLLEHYFANQFQKLSQTCCCCQETGLIYLFRHL